MFIKRIEIRGFKSIDKKTSIELTQGLNVITGPNGSGKCVPAWELIHAPNEYISAKELFEELSTGSSLVDIESEGEYAVNVNPMVICSMQHGKVTNSRVVAGFRKYKSGSILRVNTSRSHEIYLSPEHKVMLFPGIWLRSAELRKGFKIGVVEDSEIKWDVVECVEELHYKGYLFDFYVDGLHAYLAGNGPFVVHNSNILDAVKFVLGESRPRPLRTDKLSALISDKAREKRAVVKIVLDNSDKRIPTAGDEVAFVRDMGESGESDYFVDRKKTSKLIFANTLAIAGLSNRSYNIVMQGEISRLADKDPEELREELESAIGLAQYDERKTQAMEELRVADTNVKVASARLEEVRSHLESLEQERNTALRSIQINEVLKKMRATLLTSKISELKERLATELTNLQGLEQRAESVKVTIEQLSNTRKQKLSRLLELSDLLSKTETSSGGKVERRILEIDVESKARVEEVRQKRRELKHEKNIVKLLNKKIVKSKTKLELLRKQLLRTNFKLTQLYKKSRREQERARNLAQLRKKKEDIAKIIKGEVFDLETELKLLESEISIKTNAVKNLRLRAKDLKKQIERYKRNARLSSNQFKLLKTTFQRVTERARTMEKELQRKIDQLNIFNEESAHISETIQQGSLKLAEVSGKLSALKEAKINVSGLDLDDLIKGMGANVLGKLRDLIEFDAKLKSAVSVALEDWLDAYVVSDPREALAISLTLRKLGVYKGKIISTQKPDEIKKMPLDDRMLLSKIRCPDDLRPALKALIGNLRYVRSIEEARENLNIGIPVVTEDGILISPLGISRVFGTEEAGAQRIESFFTDYLNDLSRRLEEAELLKRELLDNFLIKLKEDIETTRRGLLTVEDMENELEITLGRIQEAMKRSVDELKEAEKNLEKIKKELSEERADLNAAISKRAKICHAIRKNRKSLNTVESDAKKISKDEQRSSKSLAHLGKEIEKLSDMSKMLSRSIVENQQKMLHLKTDIKSRRVRSKELRGEITKSINRIRTLRKERDELSVRLKNVGGGEEVDQDALAKERSQLTIDIEALENELEAEEAEFIECNQKVKDLSIVVDKLNNELETCERELASLGIETALKLATIDQSLIEELEEEMASLGALNMLAIEQYEKQAENYRVVSSRLNKLEEERRAIIEFMETIENEKREAFFEALKEVNKHFSDYFNKITGGSAWLELEDPENPFNGGINIIVQFPGKSPRVASALSGGEKSVVALCFIFAMQKLKPSPFYILDEVDAHLDAVNVERYANILKDRSAESQIITISLKDYVASKADKVIGVYNKGGSSRIIELPKVERETIDVEELAR
jgi:chromosome segregation protein